MSEKIAIVGAGGLGHETLVLIRNINARDHRWDILGFFDDGVANSHRISGVPVLGTLQDAAKAKDVKLVLALGDPGTKRRIAERLVKTNPFATLIHPSVVVGDEASCVIGPGSILAAGTKITTEVKLGSHVLVNLNATIGHNTIIGDCSSVMPGVNIGGSVNIGACVLVGSGSTIINNLAVGAHAKIGAGAVVIRNVRDHVTVVGVPARELPAK